MSVQCFCGSWDHEPFRHPDCAHEHVAPISLEFPGGWVCTSCLQRFAPTEAPAPDPWTTDCGIPSCPFRGVPHIGHAQPAPGPLRDRLCRCGHDHTCPPWSDEDADDGTCWDTAGALICGCPKFLAAPARPVDVEEDR